MRLLSIPPRWPPGATSRTELARIARRALANYLARDADACRPTSPAGARVALPTLALAVQDVTVAVAGSGGVLVTLRASDAGGALCTLNYELRVARTDGRWSVTSVVHAFPDESSPIPARTTVRRIAPSAQALDRRSSCWPDCRSLRSG